MEDNVGRLPNISSMKYDARSITVRFLVLSGGVARVYGEVPTSSLSSSKAILLGIRRAWRSRWQTVARSRRAFP